MTLIEHFLATAIAATILIVLWLLVLYGGGS
jgi:hypothetical protein